MVPFRFGLDPASVVDLRDRLARTRWPDELDGEVWRYGASVREVREICEHWRATYDLDAFVERCNRFPQITTVLDGQRIHAVHARSPEPHAVPLLMTHGWPGSVAELFETIGPLSDPRAHGLDPSTAFHVVCPSLPGYGFSGPTTERGWDVERTARAFGDLMRRLGYPRFFAQGGDWGALVTAAMTRLLPDLVPSVHLTMIIAGPPREAPEPADDHEAVAVAARDRFLALETGYQSIQGTKPQTLAFGLTDSPAGLAAWILEKFHGWTGGDGLASFPVDRLLDNLSIYWFTGTINSSMRLYFETVGPDAGGRWSTATPTVPIGFANFPGEPFNPPRRWVESRYNVVRWTDFPTGGHFPAMQVPSLFVDDVRAHFATQVLAD